MKILQLCSRVPFPPKDGGAIAMHNICKGLLNEGHNVKVIAVNTPKHYVDLDKIDEDYKKATRIETVFVDTSITPWGFFKSLFSYRSYNVARFYSPKLASKIARALKKEQFDIVQVESIYVAQYIRTIRRYSKAKVVLRAHNVEFEIWEKLARETPNYFKQVYFKRMAQKLKHYETRIYNKFDGIAAITDIDAAKIKKFCTKPRIVTIPFGFDFSDINFPVQHTPLSFFHIGAMDWKPNVDAIRWFVDNVWNNIREQFPQYKFHLAGRKMPDWLFQFNQNKSNNLVVIGEVASSQKFMHNKSVMISPLRAGSGMSIKIIEAMAMGKTVITTSLGAQGIEYQNSKDILIADDVQSFKAAIRFCIENPAEVENIGKNARQLIQQKYNGPQITKKLVNFYISLQ